MEDERDRCFLLHWLGGRTEVIKGRTISGAFTVAGYGAGAVKALDWYEEVEEQIVPVKFSKEICDAS